MLTIILFSSLQLDGFPICPLRSSFACKTRLSRWNNKFAKFNICQYYFHYNIVHKEKLVKYIEKENGIKENIIKDILYKNDDGENFDKEDLFLKTKKVKQYIKKIRGNKPS